jgi:NTP pyrophosphatase (non-canonical NTP hydrolase)
MHGKEYQANAKKTAHYPREFALYYVAMGLAGETGELINKIKKIIRDDNNKLTDERKEQIKQELGDTMWYIAMICEETGLNLDEVMEYNNKKLLGRTERGTINGDGDNR